MDRRYYFAKLGLVVVALGLATAGSDMSKFGAPSPVRSYAAYSAPVKIQAAAWRAATIAGQTIGCVLTQAVHGLLQAVD